MKAQAILTSLHFIGAELAAAVDLYKEKIYTTRYWKKWTTGHNIEVLLVTVCKIKLKFLISLNTRLCYITKSSLGIFFSFPWLAPVKFKMAGDLKEQKVSCKWIKLPWLFLLAIKLKCRYSTKRWNWQITYYFIDRVFYRLAYRNQREDSSCREVTKIKLTQCVLHVL